MFGTLRPAPLRRDSSCPPSRVSDQKSDRDGSRPNDKLSSGLKDLNSAVKEEWVDVKDSITPAEQIGLVKVVANPVGTSLSSRMTGVKLRNYKTKLSASVSSTASGSGSQIGTDSLNANGAYEFSNFAGIFDEFRVLKIDVYSHVDCTAATTGVECGWGYDPRNPSGSYSAASQVLNSAQNCYWVMGDSVASAPNAVTGDGLVKKTIIVPKGSSGGSTANVGADWCPTTASASATVCGYLKYYIDASSAGNTIFLRTYVYHVEFRSRS